MSPDVSKNPDTAQGFAFALTAYLLWGVLPLYLKMLDHMPPAEVVAHRILWSVPVAGLLLVLLGRTADLRAALTSGRTLAMAALTAFLVSINWGIYVWAVTSGNTVEAALGYYVNPLFSVFLGAVLLRERLNRGQVLAIALAAVAVCVLTWEQGHLPLAALGLTLSWGFYAFFKKWLPVGPNQGFLLEVLILSPFALALLIWFAVQGQGHFLAAATDTWLLLGSGLVTAVPLILYANGAKRLRLSTIAMMQYITPTMIFLLALFVFGELFDGARRIAFPMIWLALGIYSLAVLRPGRKPADDL